MALTQAVERQFIKVIARATRFVRPLVPRATAIPPWRASSDDALRQRDYKSYGEYLAHQSRHRERASQRALDAYDATYRCALSARLRSHPWLTRGMSALCLGARLGTEVKVFVELGCFAVGVDLNAGSRNRYVVNGDFNALQYGDESVDIVFTNSIEHAFDLGRLIHEAYRVLKPGGKCIVEIPPGDEEGALARNDQALSWRRCADVFAMFERAGFSLQSRVDFAIPWVGVHAVFAKRERRVGGVRFPAAPAA